MGYGLPAFRGRGAVTPFAGLTTTGTLVRDWSAGALWRRGPALEMALEATRGETAGEPPAHGGGESGVGSAPACAPERETRRAAPRGD